MISDTDISLAKTRSHWLQYVYWAFSKTFWACKAFRHQHMQKWGLSLKILESPNAVPITASITKNQINDSSKNWLLSTSSSFELRTVEAAVASVKALDRILVLIQADYVTVQYREPLCFNHSWTTDYIKHGQTFPVWKVKYGKCTSASNLHFIKASRGDSTVLKWNENTAWWSYCRLWFYEELNGYFGGHPLAKTVEWASHAQRPCPRCSGPRFESGLGPFAACCSPLSHPVSCHLSEAVISIKSFKGQKIIFEKTTKTDTWGSDYLMTDKLPQQ